jgi:hypothetical protein
MAEAGFGDYVSIGGDSYDVSIEFYSVAPDARMNEAAQLVVFDAGFGMAHVNHTDGWETHYRWGKEFKKARGWRRRYVKDPRATTTRVIAGDPDPGYYEISYWPEGWSRKEWLESGYMRIHPDPLDTFVDVMPTTGGKE